MTNDEAGHRVMVFLAESLTAFLKVAQGSMGEDALAPAKLEITSTYLSNIISELTSGELGKAMELLIEARKPVPIGTSKGSIHMWLDAVIYGTGGLSAFYRYEMGGSKPAWQDIGAWIIRCLANPQCGNSGSMVQAILDERARKLGLPEDGDLEQRLASGLLDDKMASS